MKKITLLVVASFILVGSMAYASENPVFLTTLIEEVITSIIEMRNLSSLEKEELSLCCFQMVNLTSTQDLQDQDI